MDDSDDDHDDDNDGLGLNGSDDELELGCGDGDDEEDTFVPFGKMKKWLERKPRGFGEGREYDISIEEKLLEEMEKSRPNLTTLSDDPANANSKQPQNKNNNNNNNNKAIVVAPAGVQVRVLNLPKKKNIHRDLSSAFKLVPGLISTNPAVSGNKKTKDPICKGFAFVHFKSELDATRFVEMFSLQSATFGKIQKQIKCELVDLRRPSSSDQKQSRDNHNAPQLTVSRQEEDQKADSDLDDSSVDIWEEAIPDEYEDPDVELVRPELEDGIEQSIDNNASPELIVSGLAGGQEADSDLGDSSLDAWEETILDEYDGSDVELIGPEEEDVVDNLESTSGSGLNGGDIDCMELRRKLKSILVGSSSSKQLPSKTKEEKVPRQKPVAQGKVERRPKKKLTLKEKAVKVPKLTIGGSSKRLKVKEKAVLSDVFSKYRAKAALASKGDS